MGCQMSWMLPGPHWSRSAQAQGCWLQVEPVLELEQPACRSEVERC